MKCQNCGADTTADGSLFCTECGAPLAPASNVAEGQGAQFFPPADKTMVMAEGQPGMPSPTQTAPQASAAPAHGASSPSPVTPPTPEPSKGVSVKVVVALVVAIVVLIGVVAVLVVNPFGQSNEASSRSASASSASEETSVTLKSAASQAASEPASQASEQPQEASTPTATTNAAEQQKVDPEATHGLQDATASETKGLYEREELYYNAPFWGAWIGAFSELPNAQARVSEANAKGLPAVMFETTDWENLNPTHYWVVSVGRSADEAAAQQLCAQAIEAGYSDAYVKYTGNHR